MHDARKREAKCKSIGEFWRCRSHCSSAVYAKFRLAKPSCGALHEQRDKHNKTKPCLITAPGKDHSRADKSCMSYLASHAGAAEQPRSSAPETVATSAAAAGRPMSGRSPLSRSAARCSKGKAR